MGDLWLTLWILIYKGHFWEILVTMMGAEHAFKKSLVQPVAFSLWTWSYSSGQGASLRSGFGTKYPLRRRVWHMQGICRASSQTPRHLWEGDCLSLQVLEEAKLVFCHKLNYWLLQCYWIVLTTAWVRLGNLVLYIFFCFMGTANSCELWTYVSKVLYHGKPRAGLSQVGILRRLIVGTVIDNL